MMPKIYVPFLASLLALLSCLAGCASGPGTSTGSSEGGSTGIVTAKGGGTGGIGGSTSSGGPNGTGGVTSSTGGTTSSGGGAGGTKGAGGGTTSGAGGRTTSGAGGTTGGATMDQAGVPLAKPTDSTSASRGYLNLGDMRLINNRWGSDALNCGGTTQSVFINSDATLGWSFNRPTCGGNKGDPDFPEVEFGVAPFGTASPNLTTPAFSSTTLLPIQLKNISSASVTINNFATTFPKPTYWDSNFEFWISNQDPTKNANAGVYAEVIAFLGWEANRNSSSAGGWSCDKTGNMTSAGTTYNLCHQSDIWSSGWRFFNFNVNNGPLSAFNGAVDIKAVIDWITTHYSGFTGEMWLTRIEVGTEIDDNTAGSAKINNLTFEINGSSRSVQLAK